MSGALSTHSDPPRDRAEIFRHFDLQGELVEVTPYGGGHINDTYLGRCQTGVGEARYILQRINHNVFKQPEKVMENISRVTRYAREQITAAGGDPDRETLNLIPTRAGQMYVRTLEGEYWRTYGYIQGARTYDVAQNLDQVYHAAYAFGSFQKLLASLPGERLHETIPNFHHTRKRFEAFQQALHADPANRAREVKSEIDFVLQREPDASIVVDLLASGELPERVTHNDTKLNNVLIDDITGKGICVIDLDTMMPGSALYDFGDLVRMGTATAVEDERDLARVQVNLPLFEHLARGYLDAARDILTPLELDMLVFGGRLITYEQIIRFLGDYLNGDIYYKIHCPDHNLVRARNQIKMLQELERHRPELEAIVQKYRG